VINIKRIPYVQQLEATECGAACLAMVLRYYGKDIRLDEVRDQIGLGRDGASAFSILKAAQQFGLRGRGVRMEIEDLAYLDKGAILHWYFSHFVVFERVRRGRVDIVDPAVGRRSVPLKQFSELFTGVALLLEPSDDFQPEKSSRKKFWHYLRQILSKSPTRLGLILFTSTILLLVGLVFPALTRVLVDRVIPRSDFRLLTILAAGAFATVVFHSFVSLTRNYLLLYLRTELDLKLMLDFLDHMMKLPYAFFQRRSAGDLMMRLNSNSTIREILTSTTISGLLDSVLVCLFLIVLFAMNVSMAVLVSIVALLQVLIFVLTRKRFQQLLSQDLELQARSQNYQVQIFAAIETLKASGVEHRAVERWSNLYADVINIALARGKFSARIDWVKTYVQIGAPLLFLCVGVQKVLTGEISLGTMLAINAIAAGFLSPFNSLVNTAFQLQLLGSYLERINDVLETPPAQDKDQVRRAEQLKGRISVEHLSFRYAPDAPDVLKDISLEIKPGELVAIVGPSGSGKSTLAKLLLGLYSPSEGEIRYDGTNLLTLEARSIRNQIGSVLQNSYLFGATIRENIALIDPSLPLEDVIEAAKIAEIHDDIEAMPLRYETPLMDGGASLSGGQRQRVSLAQAIVHKPAVLILDEATSHLDAVTESKVYARLQSLNMTRIVIAHRLSTISAADLIVVLDGGRVVEKGSHHTLINIGGKYSELVSLQLDGV
jgi:ABC-type bacteriocin/lantibiotic exporter with double-glycine peptidase domain